MICRAARGAVSVASVPKGLVSLNPSEGGSCRRTPEHAVPKTHRPIGPRISIQFRPAGMR
jgi:hypothetical protein